MNAAQLDLALQKLAQDSSFETKINALQALVKYWHGEITPADGYADAELAELQLPRALRWWYSWAGKRTEVVSGDGVFASVEHLLSADEFGRLWIWSENQGVFHRTVSAVGEDPLIYQSDWNGGDDGEWKCEGMSLLELLMQLCVFEAQSEYWGLADIEESQLAAFTANVPRLPISPWPAWDPAYKFAIGFFVGRGVYATVHDLAGAYTLMVQAKSPNELQWLYELIPAEQWDSREF